MRRTTQGLDDPEALVAALRAKKRRWVVALLGNALMLAVMVGGPYLRGQLRTRALWRDFGQFGACFYGGTASAEPALGIPRDEDVQFAARALAKPSGWPARCLGALERLSLPEAIFLLPALKTAELDVRAAVGLVGTELAALQKPRAPGSRLSTRPLRAIAQLRAALARHALAAGVVDLPASNAFSFAETRGLPAPARVPLYASSDAVVSVWGSDAELSALGVDRRGVSFVSVQAGQLTQTRLPRPKLLESYVGQADGGFFAWAMSAARCRERALGCASKSTGLARIALPLTEIPEPRWLAAHPASRIDRAVSAQGDAWLVAAHGELGEVAVRAFEVPVGASSVGAQELAPIEPRSTWRVRVSGQPLLSAVRGERIALVAQGSDDAARLLALTPDGSSTWATLDAGGPAWVVGCVAREATRFAFGHGTKLVLGTASATSSATVWPALELVTKDVVHDSDPSRDRVLRLCGTRAELALVRDASDRLLAVACADESSSCRITELARDVYGFAALTTERGVLVAYAGAGDRAQVRVRELDALRGEERVPSPCWEPVGGMCGAPLLTRIGTRVLLGAREGSDLLMLESPDEGSTWETMKGLRRVE